MLLLRSTATRTTQRRLDIQQSRILSSITKDGIATEGGTFAMVTKLRRSRSVCSSLQPFHSMPPSTIRNGTTKQSRLACGDTSIGQRVLRRSFGNDRNNSLDHILFAAQNPLVAAAKATTTSQQEEKYVRSNILLSSSSRVTPLKGGSRLKDLDLADDDDDFSDNTITGGGVRSFDNNSIVLSTTKKQPSTLSRERPTRTNIAGYNNTNSHTGENAILDQRYDHHEKQHRLRRKTTATIMSTDEHTGRIPVQSIYAAREINTVSVLSKVFAQPKYPTLQHRFGRMSVTIELEPRTTSTTAATVESSDSPPSLPRFVVIFRFGAVVFFNVTHRESRQMLEDIKYTPGCSSDPVPHGFEQRERFEVAIAGPSFDSSSTGGANDDLHYHNNGEDDINNNASGDEETTTDVVASDAVTVPHLDFNNVAVISTIMGQTVALDTFNVIVDELLRSFAAINAKVTQTGNFSTMDRDALFKLVAQNNSLSIDMVSKFGLKDRSDTAWNLSQYDAVYQGMREEFEIDYRFNDVELKLDIIQQNAKFFLDILHNQKSNNLEWVIIWLIALECGLMCLDMSGMGQVLFGKYFV